jgi:malate permease and related proteins
LWRAPLGVTSAKIAVSAAAGVLAGIALAYASCRLCRTDRGITGAVILASAWPNATYLGLPVLEQTLGPWARSIAIQYDLFACTPLLLTLGVLIAQRFGSTEPRENPLRMLLRVPPLWAALAAVLLNVSAAPVPEWIGGLLNLMSSAVVPLMLLSVGMALPAGFRQWRRLPSVLPVAVIQLALMPVIVWVIAVTLGLSGGWRIGVVLEAAMPTMVLGLVFCDRYGLNSGVYAAAVTVTTLAALVTLPLWYQWLS